jgi:RNA polymerase sigma-B factor
MTDDVELARRAHEGDERARHALIERYVPLARRLAWRYRRTAEPMDDLVQVASLGLVKAVDRWDPGRGFAFSSFAVPTIVGELRRHFRDTTWMVRPPRRLLELTLLVEQVREPMGAVLGRDPTAAEIAERIGRPEADVSEALQARAGRVPRSLDTPLEEVDHVIATVGDMIGHDDAGFERAEARTTVERLTSILDKRAREVLRMRFEDDLLQIEIASTLGVSQMQVSRIISRSLGRLLAHATVEPAA